MKLKDVFMILKLVLTLMVAPAWGTFIGMLILYSSVNGVFISSITLLPLMVLVVLCIVEERVTSKRTQVAEPARSQYNYATDSKYYGPTSDEKPQDKYEMNHD